MIKGAAAAASPNPAPSLSEATKSIVKRKKENEILMPHKCG